MIPDTETLDEAIPVSGYVEECPKCDNDRLGTMITLRLQYCPCCHTWLRYSQRSTSNAKHD
jgi:hypothetical protein